VVWLWVVLVEIFKRKYKELGAFDVTAVFSLTLALSTCEKQTHRNIVTREFPRTTQKH